MSVNHASIATHVPQSLPSFAQAFSTSSLGSISSGNNSLPPIQLRLNNMDLHTRTGSDDTTRKRHRADVLPNSRDDPHSNSDGSPRLVLIKEEQDHDMLPSSSPPHVKPPPPDLLVDTAGAPAPSDSHPSPAKRRRVTVSGAPHPLNTDVRPPVDQTNSTPISPVVMGFTIKRDNPSAMEQVKSMITVKQKQKALIEQRRGSVAGVISPQTGGNPVSSAPAEERILTSTKPAASARPSRHSPNTGTGPRRPTNNQSTGNPRPPSPSPIIVTTPPLQVPIQQSLQVPAQQSIQMPIQQSLAPPPISFARRRAGQLGVKKKPADIVISPREAQTKEQFQPAIQSAPPVPHAGQGSFYSGRFPMTLPRLPVMGGGDNIRRVATNVPPTPTRLSIHRNTPGAVASLPISSIANRSPPAASVPISSSLVPPTPSALHHAGYSGDKSAFLAPFETFYDALNDSKQLKNWLGEQLQRSNVLMQTLAQQTERINEVVEGLVEKRMAPMRSEMAEMHRRIEELEDALRAATSGRRSSTDIPGMRPKGKLPLRNGVIAGPTAPESYTFPPSSSPESSRLRPRPSSPGWGHDREPRESLNPVESDKGSPAPFDSTRASVSASRLDPPRSQPSEPPSQSRPSFAMPSSPQVFHDSPNRSLPPSAPQGKSLQSGHAERERPEIGRRHSSHGTTPSGEHTVSPTLRRGDSRRDSIVMTNADAPREDT